MKQKWALASALLHRPSLMLLDEPLTGLDAAAARLVKDLLAEASCGTGARWLLTTHILEVAERMAERIGIISAGRLVTEGNAGGAPPAGGRERRARSRGYLPARVTGSAAEASAAPPVNPLARQVWVILRNDLRLFWRGLRGSKMRWLEQQRRDRRHGPFRHLPRTPPSPRFPLVPAPVPSRPASWASKAL